MGGNGNDVVLGFDGPGIGETDANVLGGGPGLDSLAGSDGPDIMYLGPGGGRARGYGGNDRIYGPRLGPAEVTVYAGDGDDFIDAGVVNLGVGTEGATIEGGPGANIIRGTSGDDTIDAGGSRDGRWSRVWGLAGSDDITGSSYPDSPLEAFGGEGSDTLTAGVSKARLFGGPGVDYLIGANFDDVLGGGPGADFVGGSGGDDVLWGGPGNDEDNLDGGEGDDFCGGGTLDIFSSCEHR